jgi:hypothetical protein
MMAKKSLCLVVGLLYQLWDPKTIMNWIVRAWGRAGQDLYRETIGGKRTLLASI